LELPQEEALHTSGSMELSVTLAIRTLHSKSLALFSLLQEVLGEPNSVIIRERED